MEKSWKKHKKIKKNIQNRFSTFRTLFGIISHHFDVFSIDLRWENEIFPWIIVENDPVKQDLFLIICANIHLKVAKTIKNHQKSSKKPEKHVFFKNRHRKNRETLNSASEKYGKWTWDQTTSILSENGTKSRLLMTKNDGKQSKNVDFGVENMMKNDEKRWKTAKIRLSAHVGPKKKNPKILFGQKSFLHIFQSFSWVKKKSDPNFDFSDESWNEINRYRSFLNA